jgi:cyclic pyranopterin monophosphate synthase
VAADEELRAQRRRAGQVGRVPRPRMTDLTEAPAMPRRAVAEAEVAMSQEALSAIVDGVLAKGDVLSTAELAGVMAGKRTAELLPLAHQTPLTNMLVQASPDRAAGVVRIRTETAATAGTDVEMEALTAAAVAALAVCDMIRDMDRGAEVRWVRIVSSTGSAAGTWQRPMDSHDRPKPHHARGAGRIPGRPRQG